MARLAAASHARDVTGTLSDRLRRRIALAGPIAVSAYMAEALGDPEHGYYMTRDPLGTAGDFTTAPEISQMFGELIGLWCAEVWRQAGGPKTVRLIELGPGRGTLMADLLRAARMAPDFADALSVHLVETSPVLTARQRTTLDRRQVQWHDRLDDVPDGPALIVANEFFDALPIHQLQRDASGWRERMVGLDENGAGFRFGLAPVASPLEALIPESVRRVARPGDLFELCPAGIGIARAIGRRIADQGGAALLIDYGHAESATGDTLQAVRAHRYCDPLDDPGSADLTAHVDFAILARAASEAGATAHGPVTQGEFLSRLGIGARAETLLRRATPAQAEDIRAACRRLIGPEEMGTLFKALALTSASAPPPPGFMQDSESSPRP